MLYFDFGSLCVNLSIMHSVYVEDNTIVIMMQNCTHKLTYDTVEDAQNIYNEIMEAMK